MELESEQSQISSKKSQKQKNQKNYQSFDQSVQIFFPKDNQQKQNTKPNKQDLQEQEGLKLCEQYEKILKMKTQNILNRKFLKLGQKVIKIVKGKKEVELAYFINYIFLSVEKTHLSILSKFNNYLYEYLKVNKKSDEIVIVKYSGKAVISEILTAISYNIEQKHQRNIDDNNELSQIYMIFLFDNIYDLDSTNLNLLSKYIDEEYSEDEYSIFQFFFILPCSPNKQVQISNPSLQFFRLDFCSSEKMINKLLVDNIMDTRVPLFSFDICKKIKENFSLYCISYTENARRIQVSLQELIFDNLNQKPVLLSFNELVQDGNLDINQVPVKVVNINFKEYYLQRKLIENGLELIKVIMTKIFKEKNKTFKILQFILAQQKQNIFVLITGLKFKEPSELENLGNTIAQIFQQNKFLVENCDFFNEIIENFKNVKKNLDAKNNQLRSDTKNNKKKVNREDILLGGINNENNALKQISDLKMEIQNIFRDFIFKCVCLPYQKIMTEFPELSFTNLDNFNALFKPDLLCDYTSYLQENFDNKEHLTAQLFEIFQGFGREISLKEAYKTFKNKILGNKGKIKQNEGNKMQEEEENVQDEQENDESDEDNDQNEQEIEIKGKFLYSLNELRQMGSVDEGRKFRAVLEKNFFAKTIYSHMLIQNYKQNK